MHIAAKWIVFLTASGLFFYFTKYQFGSRHYPTKTLDGRCLYKPSAAPAVLDELGESRAAYLDQESTIDLIFPMVYGLMFAAAIVGLTPGAGAPRWIMVFPVVTVVGDYLENTTVIAMLQRYAAAGSTRPVDLGVLPWIASFASGTKGIGFVASTLAMAVLAVMWIVKR